MFELETQPLLDEPVELTFDLDLDALAKEGLLFSSPEDTAAFLEQQAAFVEAPEVTPTITFGEWLAHQEEVKTTLTTGQSLDVTATPDVSIPAFAWAEAEAEKTAQTFAGFSLDRLSLASGVLSTLMSGLGGCGAICLHGITALAGSGAGGLGLGAGLGGGLGGLTQSGMRGSLSGSLRGSADAFRRAGIDTSRGSLHGSDLIEFLALFSASFGDSLYHCFGFGLVSCLVDCLIPQGAPSR